nr:arabinosyltransferase domain-containing protein [Saccharopolyspora sp. HNM0983]
MTALAIPFAPVQADTTEVTWPQQGREPASTTAFFTPYAPAQLDVRVPCAVVQAAADRAEPTTVVSSHLSGTANEGFTVSTGERDLVVQVGGREVHREPVPAGDCTTRLSTSPSGGALQVGADRTDLGQDHVREIVAFATDLAPEDAAGVQVRAETSTWFESSPTTGKLVLIGGQLVLAAAALGLLVLAGRARRAAADERVRAPGRCGRRVRAGVDAAVLAVLGGWAVLGPRTPDDGFTEGIVRNALNSGAFTNYYRWENAAESPFTLVLHLVQPLVALEANPLVLRIPSTVAAAAVWLLLTRAVLPVLLPRHAHLLVVRALTALALLAWWLPFNLGVRPEPFVALGSTAVLACVLRATGRPDGSGLGLLGLGALAAGLTVAVNPVGIVALAPVVLLAPRIWRTVRGTGETSWLVPAAVLALLGAVAAVGVVAMFADQSWFGATRATELHRFYGPDVSWFEEIQRYERLLGFTEQGGLARRLPVLLTIVAGGCAALLLARGARGLPGMPNSYVPIGAVAVGFALLWLTPSKWTHYFGSLAGFGAAGLVTALVLIAVAAREWSAQRAARLIGACGAGAVIVAAALVFSGRNSWFLFSHYGVPRDEHPFTPLNSPLLWLAVAAVALAAGWWRRRNPGAALVQLPAVLTVVAVLTGVLVVLISFAVAPIRQSGGYSVGGQHIDHLSGGGCGILDDVLLTREVPGGVLAPERGTDDMTGFTAQGGYPDGSPPPAEPGSGPASHLWGSAGGGALSTGELTSAWFGLPRVADGQELVVNAAGRTGDGNRLVLQFGKRAAGGTVEQLGDRVLDDTARSRAERTTYPSERVVEDVPQDDPEWRPLRVPAEDIPSGADTVRVRAVDGTADPGGWLAVTGPRLRQTEPLLPAVTAGESTYVDWSMVWAAPCVRNGPRVAGGLAEAPTALVNPPADLGFDGRAAYLREVGGSFAGVDELGQSQEVPTRLRGSEQRPEYADWGRFVQVSYPVDRDAYDTRTGQRWQWGWQGPPAVLGYGTEQR